MSRWILVALGAALAALVASPSLARPSYRDTFLATYEVKPNSNLDRARCGVCHQGADKSVRNLYGAELAKALGKSNAPSAEVVAALRRIENLVGADKKTRFVERIRADRLPAGTD